MPAQTGRDMISGKSKQPHNRLVATVKNSSIKYYFHICGTTITRFSTRERTGERLQATKGQIISNKSGDSHFICTLYIKHISGLWTTYLVSLCPAGIKHTDWLKKSWVSTFSHRKNKFVPAAIQPCVGFTLDRTGPCSLEAVLWFRKNMSSLCITEHREPTDQMSDAFSGILKSKKGLYKCIMVRSSRITLDFCQTLAHYHLQIKIVSIYQYILNHWS